ncbi:MAG TPA: gephyrin-like molybdotransferase Glp [Solirubrobacteraceae bacterium]|jgi:molybdopterin molybdotransferase|nr:gephyrin-like molybdotransferase Glp [Solirubrobacteraceae bacterium]
MPTTLISVADARESVLETISPLDPETVAIDDALGRILAEDVRAAQNVPPFPCSAMDGYAILAGDSGRRLRIVGESRAGTPTGQPVDEGQAIRVSTGAAIPAGATAVIPQEEVDRAGDEVETRVASAPGQHIRGAGEDMRAGSLQLTAGSRLTAVELGAAVGAGMGRLSVSRRPRVTIVCTGDELRAPGEPLGPGEIHNSNAPMLVGLATGAGALAGPARRLPDDRGATERGIEEALQSSDVVIITGGVSVGPHDHVKPALAELGVDEVFWSVALQPGKPTWFGLRSGPDQPLVFGLPGNPVSAVVTFSLFVAPALAALQGGPAPRPPHAQAALATDVKRNPRRDQAIRVRLELGGEESGAPALTAFPNGAQGSHILTSLLRADALAMIPMGEGTLPAGSIVALEALAR